MDFLSIFRHEPIWKNEFYKLVADTLLIILLEPFIKVILINWILSVEPYANREQFLIQARIKKDKEEFYWIFERESLAKSDVKVC